MQQLYIPQFFAHIITQYCVILHSGCIPAIQASEIHREFWRATAAIPYGMVRFNIDTKGDTIMAGFGDFTFSALRIEPEDQPEFEKWLEGNTINPLEVLNQFTGDGFKVSITYVMDQNSFCLTIVGTKETKRHTSKGMTSWSDDLGEALAIAWYKHYVMCGGGDWPDKGRTGRWG